MRPISFFAVVGVRAAGIAAASCLFTAWLLISCSSGNERTVKKQKPGEIPFLNHTTDTLPKLTTEQQTAFDALNSIQGIGINLYSTFPGFRHRCLPADTSFVISQAELLIAIETLLERHYTHIKTAQRTKLANQSVLAQKEYLVLQCYGYSNRTVNDKNKNIPNWGSWILPEILGRRDLVIEW